MFNQNSKNSKHLITYLIMFMIFTIICSFSLISKSLIDYSSLVLVNILILSSFYIGTNLILKKVENKSQAQFNAAFFGVTGLRMIFIIIILSIYLIINKPANVAGVIFIISTYFIYMGFEIRFILHKLRPDLQNQKANENARK
jgi:Kef-type K+ transport system membrane component KefB